MHLVLLLTLAAAAPAPADEPPAKKELFAGEAWYKSQKGKEGEFTGLLEKVERGKGVVGFGRFNPYRLVMTPGDPKAVREVYVGGKPDLLAPYIGKKIKLTGKAVDLEVEGWQHREIWPARLEVVAGDNSKEGQAGGGKELKVLARAPWRFGVQDGTQHQYVIRSQDELEAKAGKQAEALLKALKVDKIDWKTQMLVMASAGAKPTGGFRVEIDKLAVDGTALTVHWKLHTPKGFVTQAFTHPAEAVLVGRFDGTVKFDPPAAKGKEK